MRAGPGSGCPGSPASVASLRIRRPGTDAIASVRGARPEFGPWFEVAAGGPGRLSRRIAGTVPLQSRGSPGFGGYTETSRATRAYHQLHGHITRWSRISRAVHRLAVSFFDDAGAVSTGNPWTLDWGRTRMESGSQCPMGMRCRGRISTENPRTSEERAI